MSFKDAFNKYVQALKELAKWPGVEPVNKELTKDCKPLYVDWRGDDNCTECFGEDCSTCAINLAHRYGTAECDPSEIDWPGDESCAECPDCDCENCSILLSHKDDSISEEDEDFDPYLTCPDQVCAGCNYLKN